MRSFLEIGKEMNTYYLDNEEALNSYREELLPLDEMDPNDPLAIAYKSLIEERWLPVTNPYRLLGAEYRMAYHQQKGDIKQRKDHARSVIDPEHPRHPMGPRLGNEAWDWNKEKDKYYGPGGKLLDEDKKIIFIPGIEGLNRASSAN